MIHSSWGGTPAETWMPEKTVMNNPDYAAGIEKLYKQTWWPIRPGQAYNAMIHPLLNYRIAGAIWYQGESNSANPLIYKKLFPDMIVTWRKLWGIDFPFYYVQIAPYNYKGGMGATLVREAQLLTLSLPKTGMAVTNDIGNVDNIHPRDKEEVGRRLALWALAKTYGKNDIVYSGPLYNSMKINKNKIEISFDHIDSGLVKKGKTLSCFQIAGDDHKFVKANAVIKDDKVIVSNKKIKNPIAVRFAFSDTAEPNLFNSAGLPASAFRTDDWSAE
jgi:sialate O-acetylesterase